MKADLADTLLRQAAQRHAAGDLSGAEPLYRAALQAGGPNAVALHLLGAVLQQTGRAAEAVDHLERASALAPTDPEIRANLGGAFLAVGRPEDALKVLNVALDLAPSAATARVNRSAALRELGRFEEARDDADQAVASEPGLTSGHANAGNARQSMGDVVGALACFERGLAIAPTDAILLANAGVALRALGRLPEARSRLEAAVRADPDLVDAHHNLGAVAQAMDDFPAAEAGYRAALDRLPSHVGALNNVASLDLMRGAVLSAIATFDTALSLRPMDREASSNRLFALNYADLYPPEFVFEAHRSWGAALPAAAPWQPKRSPTAGRPLRIGLLSPDFWLHPVASFVEPILRAVDRAEATMIAFSDRVGEDAVTTRLRSLSDEWDEVGGIPGPELVERLRAAELDVLIELAGHTAQNRLADLVARAAPVQMTAIGYPNTTGLPTMNFRLTDAVADPVGLADTLHTEKLVRLPRCFLCWQPPLDAPPPERSTDRPVTFGSFNTMPKLSAATVGAWAAILAAVPGSRLLMKARGLSDPATVARVTRVFAQNGVATDRIVLSGWRADPRAHLATYAGVDVALDPFPYNGTTTTVEALWMGVPVVTLTGATHAGRVGTSLLTHLGLPELIAPDVSGYVGRAVALARDSARLTDLRQRLRPMLAASEICDAAGYARALENVWRSVAG